MITTLKGLNQLPLLFILPPMTQSLAKILVHTVFSTKERRPFLREPGLREELHRYLGGILNNLDCQPIIVGGVEDHVHILFIDAIHDGDCQGAAAHQGRLVQMGA